MVGDRRKRYVETPQYLGMVGRMIRGAGNRVAQDDADVLADLIALQAAVDAAVLEGVRGLRKSGATWQDIGDACGTTRQAANMRWAKRI
jgi:hypothetical protein